MEETTAAFEAGVAAATAEQAAEQAETAEQAAETAAAVAAAATETAWSSKEEVEDLKAVIANIAAQHDDLKNALQGLQQLRERLQGGSEEQGTADAPAPAKKANAAPAKKANESDERPNDGQPKNTQSYGAKKWFGGRS